LEPFETVEPNNQLVQLSEDEAAEILRVLRELTERLQAVRPALVAAAERIRCWMEFLPEQDLRGILLRRCRSFLKTVSCGWKRPASDAGR